MNSINRKDFVDSLNDSFNSSDFRLGNDKHTILCGGFSCKSKNIDIVNLWAEKVFEL